MKMFILVISVYIAIFAYNIYVPSKSEFTKENGYYSCYGDRQGEGLGVGLFFGVSSLIALLCLDDYFEKRRRS